MRYIVHPRNKKEAKVLEKGLNDLSIAFYTEDMEDDVILKAMKKAKKSRLLNLNEKSNFLQKLKTAKKQ